MISQAPTAFKYTRGFTFLELMVVMCLIAILAVAALNNYRKVLVNAERVTVEQSLSMLQNSASILVAEALVAGKMGSLQDYHKANPMQFLLKPPVNYLGELSQVSLTEMPTGYWFFDLDAEALVYLIQYPDYVETGDFFPKRLIFQLELSYRDENQDGQYQPETDKLNGLVIRPVIAFQWLEKE